MTVDEIRRTVLAADPFASHYRSTTRNRDYTTWREYLEIPLEGDDIPAEEAWAFQVDRFTKEEEDPVAKELRRVLNAHPGIGVEHRILPDPDGWIHHVFTCRGL